MDGSVRIDVRWPFKDPEGNFLLPKAAEREALSGADFPPEVLIGCVKEAMRDCHYRVAQLALAMLKAAETPPYYEEIKRITADFSPRSKASIDAKYREMSNLEVLVREGIIDHYEAGYPEIIGMGAPPIEQMMEVFPALKHYHDVNQYFKMATTIQLEEALLAAATKGYVLIIRAFVNYQRVKEISRACVDSIKEVFEGHGKPVLGEVVQEQMLRLE
jgi:hypothetical protein